MNNKNRILSGLIQVINNKISFLEGRNKQIEDEIQQTKIILNETQKIGNSIKKMIFNNYLTVKNTLINQCSSKSKSISKNLSRSLSKTQSNVSNNQKSFGLCDYNNKNMSRNVNINVNIKPSSSSSLKSNFNIPRNNNFHSVFQFFGNNNTERLNRKSINNKDKHCKVGNNQNFYREVKMNNNIFKDSKSKSKSKSSKAIYVKPNHKTKQIVMIKKENNQIIKKVDAYKQVLIRESNNKNILDISNFIENEIETLIKTDYLNNKSLLLNVSNSIKLDDTLIKSITNQEYHHKKIQILSKNYSIFLSFLQLDDIYSFSSSSKFTQQLCIKYFLDKLSLYKNYINKKLDDILNLEVEKKDSFIEKKLKIEIQTSKTTNSIDENLNELNTYNKNIIEDSKAFRFSKGSEKSIELLNKQIYSRFFLNNTFPDGDDLYIFPYKIFLILTNSISLLKEMKHQSNYKIWNEFKEKVLNYQYQTHSSIEIGTILSNVILNFDYSSFKTMFNLLSFIGFDFKDTIKVTPNYYSKSNGPTGLIIFLIKDFFDYVGIVISNRTCIEKAYSLFSQMSVYIDSTIQNLCQLRKDV